MPHPERLPSHMPIELVRGTFQNDVHWLGDVIRHHRAITNQERAIALLKGTLARFPRTLNAPDGFEFYTNEALLDRHLGETGPLLSIGIYHPAKMTAHGQIDAGITNSWAVHGIKGFEYAGQQLAVTPSSLIIARIGLNECCEIVAPPFNDEYDVQDPVRAVCKAVDIRPATQA